MALIRCPQCDTLHDLDDALLASGRRKMRCASCRTVFEASADESGREVTIAMPLPPREAAKGRAAGEFSRAELGEPPLGTRGGRDDENTDEATAQEAPDESAADDFDAMSAAMEPQASDADAEAAAMEAAMAGGSAAGEDISAEDLEALFADDAPAPPPAAVPGAGAEDADLMAQAMGEVPDSGEGAAAQGVAGEGQATEGENSEVPPLANAARRANRRDAGAKKTGRKTSGPGKGGRGMVAAMVMAAGFASVGSLVMLRDDVVRFIPGLATVFDRVGLATRAHGLDIVELQSQMMSEEGRETLEVTGRIINNTKRSLKLPVLRLAIRGSVGNELYVWTASADVPELAPGQATLFSRRLASPPPEAHSVMVRFVAKDDIVAAIR